MEPKEIVRAGYDKVSYAYRGDDINADCSKYEQWLNELTPLLPPRSNVLDLGCGCGVPAARQLAQSFSVTGVDLSPVQIERGKGLVPNANFLCADMTELSFPAHSFDAVVSFYAIIHIPLEEQPPLFENIRRWLKPQGYFMGTVGHTAWTGTEQNWLEVEGGTMYWSHADAATYQDWLIQIGFDLCWTRFIPEGKGGHTLLLAQSR